MPLDLTEEHGALRLSAQRFLDDHCGPAAVRAAMDRPDELLPWWDRFADLGWAGLAVREAFGGSGYGLMETAVIIEALGGACAPGPTVTSLIVAAIIDRCVDVDSGIGDVLRTIVAGAPAALQVKSPGPSDASRHDRAGSVVVGASHWGDRRGVTLVVDAFVAEHVLNASHSSARGSESVDVTRPACSRAQISDTCAEVAQLPFLARDPEEVENVTMILFACEAIGIAQWCVETASRYAKDRVQFGRPIGQFQGVKHRCADMLARTELARAAVWDAVRALDDPDNGGVLAYATAHSLAFEAAFECAKDCIQVLGGIGFTWEHDAHLYLRRAMTLRSMFGTPHAARVTAARAALDGARRKLAIDLGAEADLFRHDVATVIDRIRTLDPVAQRHTLAETGYMTPAWPAPWGRDAGALEMLVIDEAFRSAGVARPSISIGGWAIPNVIIYGTQEQQERWIMPTLRGEITWCQLFSEPGAGSDLASLRTTAVRGDGGWMVNGQKVWTSMAKEADWGILLARTNPEADKHDGISCFMLDMRTEGIDVRPLRELTGHAMFNEVFLDGVFIPDDCLIGVEHDGWRCARTTLANERVFMGGNSTIGGGVAGSLKLLAAARLQDDTHALALVGELVTTGHALSVLGFRLTLTALGGADPSGSEAAVRKLLGVQHDQRTQEVAMELCGTASVFATGDAAQWVNSFLFNRCLSIAGGTTEVQKNVIGERLLGLPRD